MRILKKSNARSALGVAASAVSLAAFVLATPASAATAVANGTQLCVNNYLNTCHYWTTDNDPYVPDMGKYINSSSGTAALQDRISSISIQNAKTLYTWNDNNFQGIQGVFQNNYTWNVLNYPYNDSISSVRTWG
ncbi:hypothetical protein [Streptomyces sp. NRRL B-24572]|uniref:hypothetical protein n=1 Tax=Streptomyces sp. NRRL B-24572 TaxID=1962156 RepID=UPI00117D5178|nr:hypothetical protein [Streptomyces sp. NRRL B-24572]